MKKITDQDLEKARLQLSYALGATEGLMSHMPNKGMCDILDKIKLSLNFSLTILQIEGTDSISAE